MELTHTFTIPAGPDDAWGLLTDLHRVGSCFPGATVTEADAQEFSGTVKVKLGPIALTYAGTGRFVERDDAGHRAVIEARGKDKRGNGTASATVTMSLTGDGDGSRVEVLTDLSVTGKPAQFGRGVMQDVSDKLLGQFVACIESQFADGDGQTEGAASGSADAPTGVASAEVGSAAPHAAKAGSADGPTGGSAASSEGDGRAAASVAALVAPAAAGTPAAAPAAPSTSTAEVPAPPVAPTPSPSPQGAPSERPRTERAAAARQGEDAIDLGSAVLPVLLQRYAGALAVGVAGFVVGVLVGRAGRR